MLIIAGDVQLVEKPLQNEFWQVCDLVARSGSNTISLSNGKQAYLSRRPRDEMDEFVNELERLLSGHKRRVSFEPNDPKDFCDP